MKCISIISFILVIMIMSIGLVTYKESVTVDASQFLRIHVRANSNEQVDQIIKYEVKNEVVNIITPLLVNCASKKEVMQTIKDNENMITKVVNHILKEQNFSYEANMEVKKEYFPTRSYYDIVLESGVYDAIILNLGSGEGNNWWCVVYPPLCFTGEGTNTNIIYKSKIVEMIKNFFES